MAVPLYDVRCGDQLAELAIQNNWEGIIVNGCIRDSEVINAMDIGIKAHFLLKV
jgi:regulator of RNase E activity RraA